MFFINIVKAEELEITKSSNTKLSSLYLSRGEFQFDNKVRTYSVVVDNSVTITRVYATLSDKKAKFVSGYGPRDVSLKIGYNKVEIRVQAEDGEVASYIIGVIRSDGTDLNDRLINIELSIGKIDFKPEMHTYSFSVESNINEIIVKGVSESYLSKVYVTDIDGNKRENKITSKLKVGNNKILIEVISEGGSKSEYQLNIAREDYDSTENYLKNINIKNYHIKFSKDNYDYDLIIKNEEFLDFSIVKEVDTATYQIEGNENLKNNSIIRIKVSDSEGSIREYRITIHKNEKDKLLKISIVVIEGIVIIILLVYIAFSKKKNKRH